MTDPFRQNLLQKQFKNVNYIWLIFAPVIISLVFSVSGFILSIVCISRYSHQQQDPNQLLKVTVT